MVMYRWYSGFIILLGVAVSTVFAPQAEAVPSFSRQTGMACAACHTSYPGLTQLGREFKLNGYQMDGLAQVSAPSSKSAPGLSINKIPNLSLILQVGEEGMSKKVAQTQNPAADFPKEFGLYYAGRIAPHVGTFLQVTYDSGGSLGMDMSDVRYARATQLFSKNTIWGLDFNNGPTFEDVWNSTPGYGWPYVENNAPVGPQSPFIASDAVMTNVIGFGGYQYWDGLVYTYLGLYQAAPQGNTPAAYGGGMDPSVSGAAPYYRVAITPLPNLEIGSFGLFSDYHANMTGAPNPNATQHYSDIGVDSQYQLYPNNDNILTFHATYIHERLSDLSNTVPGYSGSNTLNTDFFNVDGNWYYEHRYGIGVGYFYSHGDRSSYYYDAYGSPGDGTGFQPNSRPDTNGEMVQLDWLPWQNTRFSFQYIAYNKFNGAVNDYNGQGRNASDNDTWLLNALFGF